VSCGAGRSLRSALKSKVDEYINIISVTDEEGPVNLNSYEEHLFNNQRPLIPS